MERRGLGDVAGGLVPECIREDDLSILAGFEWQSMDVLRQGIQEIVLEEVLDQSVDMFLIGFRLYYMLAECRAVVEAGKKVSEGRCGLVVPPGEP
jgi:hypothetical protein